MGTATGTLIQLTRTITLTRTRTDTGPNLPLNPLRHFGVMLTARALVQPRAHVACAWAAVLPCAASLHGREPCPLRCRRLLHRQVARSSPSPLLRLRVSI